MLSNKEISAQFDLLANLLEFAGENPFKVKSYSVAAFRISKLSRPLMTLSDAEIKNIEHIGPAVISKIDEIKKTGTIEALQQLLASTPPGILDIMAVKGLGIKKVRQLYLELEIESLGELLYAAQENHLISLKGFSKKTQDNIIKNIQFIQNSKGKLLYCDVEDFVSQWMTSFVNAFPEHPFELVGDIGMQQPIVEVVTLVTTCPLKAITAFLNEKKLQHHIQEQLLSIVFEDFINIEIHCCTLDAFEKAIFRMNTTTDFYKALQTHYPLSDYSSDKDYFKQINKPYLPPAKRTMENWDKWESGHTSNIHVADIHGLIHCHSTWSDGSATIEQMAQACIERDLEYMVITDHSQAAFYANGLTRERILKQHKEIDQLNIKLAPFKIFKGIEADILNLGDIDYDEAVWKSMDVIIASVHSNLRMDQEKATKRILKALDNPFVTILGHPTGRLLLSRAGYPLDMEAVIQKCMDKNIAIELNAHPRRLDIDWTWINKALNKGVALSINPDAHSIEGIDLIKYGVLAAQKTMLAPEQNLSSYTLKEFEDYLKKRKNNS